MFDIGMADFTRLDERPARDRFARPEHVEAGLTLLAGDRPRPFHSSMLYQLTLVEPGTEAEELAREEAAAHRDQFAAAADAAKFESAEQDAYLTAQQRHAAGRAELAKAEAALRAAEGALQAAVREARNPAGLRKPVEDARQAVADARAWVQRLAQVERAAADAVAQKRAAVLRELVAHRLAELAARRTELREAATAAVRSFGTELLTIDAEERALRG